MEKSTSTPIVNSSMLTQRKNETVQLFGKVEKITPTSLMLQTSDLGTVEVVRQQNISDVPDVPFITVVGRVDSEGERVREFRSIGLGDKLELNLVEECIQLQARFPDLFT